MSIYTPHICGWQVTIDSAAQPMTPDSAGSRINSTSACDLTEFKSECAHATHLRHVLSLSAGRLASTAGINKSAMLASSFADKDDVNLRTTGCHGLKL